MGTPDERGDLAVDDGSALVGSVRGPGAPRSFAAHLPFLGSLLRRFLYLRFMLRVRTWLREHRPEIVQVNKTPFCGVIPPGMPRGMTFIYDVRQLGLWDAGTRVARLRNLRAVLKMKFHSRCDVRSGMLRVRRRSATRAGEIVAAVGDGDAHRRGWVFYDIQLRIG